MEINSQVVDGLPAAAATVVMLRDASDGLQVFLQRRHDRSRVLGGAHVFPGGKLDAEDAAPEFAARMDRSPVQLHARLNEQALSPATAASLYVAAMREVFEEAGILFARDATQADVDQGQVLMQAGLTFVDVLAQLGLRLQTEDLVPWSRWITPTVPSVTNRRFDTRFFMSAMPEGQTPRHDDVETTESVWLTPREALRRYWTGGIELAPPQIMSLAHLSHFQYVDEALADARSRPPPVVAPEPFSEDGLRVVCYPGDARHPVRERALPGPTRLVYRNKRFEPAEGFDALFTPALAARPER